MDKKGKYTYDWPRPMVSVDVAVFTFSEDKAGLLLINRKNEPFKGRWALPGGFVEIDEELEDAAARELAEETGLKGVPLEQLHTFGDVGRDPRGRQITIVFMGIAKSGQDKIKAGDDAAEAQWFDIEKLPKDLAFDHNKIVKFAINGNRKMGDYKRVDWIEEFVEKLFPTDSESLAIEDAFAIKEKHLPKSIFKYRSVDENSLKDLMEDSVWLTNPKDFNDPYDSIASLDTCAIRDQVVKDNMENIIKNKGIPCEIICKAKTGSNPLAVLYSYFLKGLNPNIQAKIKSVLDEAQSLLDDATWNHFNQRTLDSLKVCSFGGNNGCLLMWSHYADWHRGFCIEYDLQRFEKDDYQRKLLFPVIYSDNLFDVTQYWGSTNNLYPILMAIHKHTKWSYEEEWRLIFPGGIMENDSSYNIGLPKAIYLGARISQKNMDEIIKIATEKNVSVFRMNLQRECFKLIPQQIL